MRIFIGWFVGSVLAILLSALLTLGAAWSLLIGVAGGGLGVFVGFWWETR